MDTKQIKKTIFITISRGSLIRNFFHTGVVGMLLKSDIKVVVLTPDYSDEELFKEFIHENLLIEPLINSKKLKFEKILREFLRGAIFNRSIYVNYTYRIVGERPSKILYVPRMLFFAPLRYIPWFKKFIRSIDLKINPQKEHDYLFEKYKPDLVFATTPHDGADISVLKGAKRFSTKTVSMPKSWDNLSKILFNVKTDYMFVWSKFMKDQAIKFQDYKENEVIITGIPQFDYYFNKENLLSKEQFCRQFNFDPKKKIILYTSAGADVCNESDYVKLIKKYINEGKLENIQVLVRPHLGYKGDAIRFKEIEKYDNFVIDKSDKPNNKFKDNWDTSIGHLKNLFNSLHHADVCINAVSTMTLDATACNTPVINIKFDVIDTTDPELSAKRLYILDYVDAMVSIDGTWIAESEEEYLRLIKNILNDRQGEKTGTKKLLDNFIYKVDGKSSERVAHNLIDII